MIIFKNGFATFFNDLTIALFTLFFYFFEMAEEREILCLITDSISFYG